MDAHHRHVLGWNDVRISRNYCKGLISESSAADAARIKPLPTMPYATFPSASISAWKISTFCGECFPVPARVAAAGNFAKPAFPGLQVRRSLFPSLHLRPLPDGRVARSSGRIGPDPARADSPSQHFLRVWRHQTFRGSGRAPVSFDRAADQRRGTTDWRRLAQCHFANLGGSIIANPAVGRVALLAGIA